MPHDAVVGVPIFWVEVRAVRLAGAIRSVLKSSHLIGHAKRVVQCWGGRLDPARFRSDVVTP